MKTTLEERIDIENCDHYASQEVQLAIWRKMCEIATSGNISHGGIFEELSMLCQIKGLRVFTPLRGEVTGCQHYQIPDGNLFGSRRHLSYYLQADEYGCPVHFPARFLARTQGYDLYIRVKALLKNQYGDDSISHFLSGASAS